MDNQTLNDTLAATHVLINVSMKSWAATAPAKDLAAEVAGAHGASPDAVKVTKKLMAGADGELDNVLKLQRAVRTHLYAKSVPWSNAADGAAKRGPRLVNVATSVTLLGELATLQSDFDQARTAFKAVYAQRVQEALQAQGNMSTQDDYPDPATIDEMFDIAVDVMPCPAVSDFSRMSIPAELADQLGKNMADKQSKAMKNAMADLHGRVAKAVGVMAEQMAKHAAGDKTRLYSSMVDNVQELAELVRSNNFTDDAGLDSLAKSLDDLAAHDIKQIKNSVGLAGDLARKAAALAASASGFFETPDTTPVASGEITSTDTAIEARDWVNESVFTPTTDDFFDSANTVAHQDPTPVVDATFEEDEPDYDTITLPDGTKYTPPTQEDDEFDLDNLLD